MPQGHSLADFKAALFDVDGTLVDSLFVIIGGLGDAFERFAGVRPPDTEIRSLIGLPLRKQLALYLPEVPSDLALQEMIAFTISRFEANAHLERTFQPAVETLRLCHEAGMKTALVTSKTDIELDQFLHRFSGARFVDATVCASDVHQPKPHPESALLACSRLEVSPSDAVMIGDSVYDLRCAADAGVATIAVGYGSSRIVDLLAERPDRLFETPESLLEWARHSLLELTCPGRK